MRAMMTMTLAAVMVLAASGPARAQYEGPAVLKHVPDNAALVVLIPKVSDLNAKLGKFLKDLGAPPAMHAPMTALVDELGIAKGVDMDGSAALVMPTLQLMGEPRMYMLVPVADPVAFMTNFESAAPSERSPDVLAVPLGNAPQGYLKMVDGGAYAVLGDNEQTVAKQASPADAGKLVAQAGELGRGVMAESDAMLYLNMSRVGPILQPMMAMALGQAILQMENDPEAAAAMGGPEMAKLTLQTYQQVLSTLLLQTDAVVIGGQVGDAGVTINTAAQFKADSGPAKVFRDVEGAAPDLDRLPAKPYLFAMTMDNRAIDWPALAAAANEQLVAKLPEDSPMADLVRSYVGAFEVMGEFTSAQFAWYAGEAGNPADLMNFAYVYGAEDPAAAMAAHKRAMKDIAAATVKMTQANEGMEVPTTTMTYHEGDAEVAGVTVDRLETQIDMPEEMMQMNPMAGMFAQPWNMYLTATDVGLVMAMSGEGTELMAETLKASDGSGKLGSAGEAGEAIALSRKGLPAERFGEGYVHAGGIIEMAMNMVAAMGMPMQRAPVPDMPPLGIALTSEDGAVGLAYHAPIKLIHGMRDYMQAQMQLAMQGAMAGPHVVGEAAPAQAPAPTGVNAVTDAGFEGAAIESEHPVLVMFSASWSAECRKQMPIIQALADDFEGQVKFLELDVDNNPETVKAHKVQAIPTILLIDGGEVVETYTGPTAKDKLAVGLRKALAD